MTIVMQGVLPETREAANEKGIRTYSETYWLTTNQKTDGTYEIGSVLCITLTRGHGALESSQSAFLDTCIFMWFAHSPANVNWPRIRPMSQL